MELEWDEAKNQQNIAKHAIDFVDARRVFSKPLLVRPDEKKDYGEKRWIALGDLNGIVVVLVFTHRGRNNPCYLHEKGE